MIIEHNAIVKDRYEVIVVGAGLGGLTAAALLARKGMDVLLIEQHYMPGGCCAAIRRQGVTMDVGTAIFYGFGEKGMNTHRFVHNELEEEIDMISRESIVHMYVGDRIIGFWDDFQKTFDGFVRLFPNQKAELKKFYDYLYDLYDVVLANPAITPPSESSPLDGGKMFLSNPLGMLKLSVLMFKSGIWLFEKFFTDQDLIDFFDMLTRVFSYVDSIECPAMLSATMFTENHEGGAYYPSGSPQMLPNKLERAFEKFGGQTLYRHEVEEILIEKGTAVGVKLANGRTIASNQVVYNGTVWNLYGKVVKPRHISPKRMKWAHKFIPVHSNLMLYLGVDAKAFPKEAHPMEIIIEDPQNVAGHGITVYLPSLIDPSLAPPGIYAVTISSVSSEKWPSPWETEYQSEKYIKQKEQAADKVLDRVEKKFPGFKKHIKFMEIATPATMERFTLKNWGNIGGPKQALGQDMMKRPKARTDWKNLYFCGDSTVMGLGALPATMSAVGAANMALKDAGIKVFRPRKFNREYVNIVQGKALPPLPKPGEALTEVSVKRLAWECQHCSESACTKGCPAQIDMAGFHRRVECGNMTGAARAIREMNPLAELCGKICPAEKFCEKNCYRRDYAEGPMRIADIHGWVCGHYTDRDSWYLRTPPAKVERIAVVGAGPAGLACAYFLRRLGYRVDLFEKRKRAGGIPAHAIPDHRLKNGILDREIKGIMRTGIRVIFEKELGKDYTVRDLERDYSAIFLSPGLGQGGALSLPGVKKAETIDALSLLQKLKVNGSRDFKKQVLVIGGGSVAADAAMCAKNAGAKEIDLVCLETEDQMPMLKGEVAELKKQGVKIHNGWGPKEFLSAKSLKLNVCTVLYNSKGEFQPALDKRQSMNLKFDQLVWAIGQQIDSGLRTYLSDEFGGALLPSGLLDVKPANLQMKIDGRYNIFAGGDIIRGAGTIVEAVADGRKAAAGIDTFLNRKI